MKKLIGTSVVALLLGGLALPAGAAGAKATMVFEDPAGDAGTQNTGGVPPGSMAGFDLIKGEIVQEKKTEIKWVVSHESMPATSQPGEAFRFIWGFSLDGKQYEWTVKSVDVGEPDVVTSALAQQPYGEERVGQVYQGVARLEECVDEALPAVLTLVNCRVAETYEATFDAGAGTVSWKVPLASLKAKTGTLIGGGTTGASNTNCQICWVPHVAERSLTPRTVIDAAVQTVTYKVPKK